MALLAVHFQPFALPAPLSNNVATKIQDSGQEAAKPLVREYANANR
jgi:hypothetical protein